MLPFTLKPRTHLGRLYSSIYVYIYKSVDRSCLFRNVHFHFCFVFFFFLYCFSTLFVLIIKILIPGICCHHQDKRHCAHLQIAAKVIDVSSCIGFHNIIGWIEDDGHILVNMCRLYDTGEIVGCRLVVIQYDQSIFGIQRKVTLHQSVIAHGNK